VMLKRRLIPVLFLKDGWMVRSENFKIHQFIGSPILHVERMVQWDVDELIVLNISSSGTDQFQHDRHDYRGQCVTDLYTFISRIAQECRIPLTFGGKIRSFEQVQHVLHRGADKVSINTLLFENPTIVSDCIKSFGSQAIVGSVDYKVIDGEPIVFRDHGNINTNIPLFDWLKSIEELGVGEVLLNSVQKDGKANGYDIDTISKASDTLEIPLIACGGAGLQKHFLNCFSDTRASGVAAGNIFHFTENAYPRAKDYLAKHDVNIRKRT
jgi:cyclase